MPQFTCQMVMLGFNRWCIYAETAAERAAALGVAHRGKYTDNVRDFVVYQGNRYPVPAGAAGLNATIEVGDLGAPLAINAAGDEP